ncbi:class I SAM-dependent methyltransferase [Hoeflea prorocentri]|uniref:Class I SAM-dependent methyltransferase n=1 Tax=Hoeflea prorocentri TaxID=1922333 RepID=A0A9X3UG27_9HYPH|nr:class I SAM-dependent methyltransferase [Hoeflea prorocentri]MCY6380688.1 class I SAM-dependent methyltransferase [Hoeflea prorocentri]MDA5398488.1 class I SAM-dependent methyltransferase [Hoeflea prorocentri]
MQLVRHFWAMFLYRVHYWMWDRWFETREAVATRGTLHQDDLSPVNSAHAKLSYEYGASPRLVLGWILKGLNEDLSRFSFVDYGSGRGRMLLTAAQWPFRLVHGIEFSSILHEQAERNISGYPKNHLKCRDIKSVCCDVMDYDTPKTDCILYFYNPFEGELLDKVIRKYSHCDDSGAKRKVIIVYYNSMHRHALNANERIRPRPMSRFVKLIIKLFSPHPVHIYELAPA